MTNAELEKIKKLLEDHENRITTLEGTNKRKKMKRTGSKEGAYGYLLELRDDGFFDKPKTLKEIVTELARLGHYYKSTSLTNPLQRLIIQKKLGRIGKRGKWQYVKR